MGRKNFQNTEKRNEIRICGGPGSGSDACWDSDNCFVDYETAKYTCLVTIDVQYVSKNVNASNFGCSTFGGGGAFGPSYKMVSLLS